MISRALRAFADGYVAVLLPAYLVALGFGQFEVGLLSTVTLAGSALATLAVGAVGHRWAPRRLLLGAALLMAATGIGFAGLSSFWPLVALFSVDAFAGGLVVNSLLSLWLFERFGFTLVQAGVFFFWTGLLAAGSQLAAPLFARRIGLLNTTVFSHIPPTRA